jgi:hypothetical protein
MNKLKDSNKSLIKILPYPIILFLVFIIKLINNLPDDVISVFVKNSDQLKSIIDF